MKEISRDLLNQAAQGNLAAFEEVYQAASGMVYSVAFRITQNRDDAEEVTQDVFLKVHKNLRNFQFQSSFKTWIYRITVNTAINAYRKSSKEIRRRVDFDTTLQIQAAKESAEDMAKQHDAEGSVSKLLNILNPDQRACIILREIQGLDYREMAEALRININTVRSRLKRAREALAQYARNEVIKDELQSN